MLAVIAANHHLLNECQAKYLVISFEDNALDYEQDKFWGAAASERLTFIEYIDEKNYLLFMYEFM